MINEFTNNDFENLSPSEHIVSLMRNTRNIRNICILAHVDHGKTSLMDSLISYNNVINPKLAGQIRYMDSREDEQQRRITMKSSSIAVAYHSEILNQNYLLNLIDSPGHIDFSSEVSIGLKACDGAIIVIDVVEGICSQTISVIKQAWNEKIKCVLVLNKIDRLITEVGLTPAEAYYWLYQIMESVNSLMSSLILQDIDLEEERRIKNSTNILNIEDNVNHRNSIDSSEEELVDLEELLLAKENEVYFSPEKGNVVFASAVDCWAFTLDSFAEMLCKKLGFKKEAIVKLLWGEYYFNPRTKKVSKQPISNSSNTMFVEFVLENIYKLYNIICNEKSKEKIEKACKSFNIVINNYEFNLLENDPKPLLRLFMRQWLPIPSTVFDVIANKIPNPQKNLSNKLKTLFVDDSIDYQEYPCLRKIIKYSHIYKADDISEYPEDQRIENFECICYISKVVTIPVKNIIGLQENNTNNDDLRLMPFARCYTGTIKRGKEYYVIGPKHDPKNKYYDIHKIKFDRLYYFMGQSLEPVDEILPGCVFSVLGLESFIFKTGTISEIFNFPTIRPSNNNKNSIIKVSVSTEDHKDINKMVEGLKILNKADPALDYYVQSNGEHILVTSGEVHLDRAIRDLEDHFCKCPLRISPPIVNFKEGLANHSYSFKPPNKQDSKGKSKSKKDKTNFEVINKKEQRKRDILETWDLSSGEEDIDKFDINDFEKKNSSMPMAEPTQRNVKKRKVEVKNKIKDYQDKKEKKDFFLQKRLHIDEQGNVKKAYAEMMTPNKVCEFVISSFGLKPEMIKVLEKYESVLKKVENYGFNGLFEEETLESIRKFKNEFLQLFESKRQRNLIEDNLLWINASCRNLLIVRNILPENTFFGKLRISSSEDTNRKPNGEGIYLEDYLMLNLKEQITPREFINAIKSGFSLAISNGPLCEEEMYGVVFVVENVKMKKIKFTEEKDINSQEANKFEEYKEGLTLIKEESEQKEDFEQLNQPCSIQEMISIQNENLSTIKIDEEFKEKSSLKDTHVSHKDKTTTISKVTDTADGETVSSKQYHQYGPFLGQIIGTVKECSRLSYLQGEPRLYEALYLCTFQLNIENIGKIHSVINKRRGRIIDEKPHSEGTICTIEAVVPVAESFGFVAEIRKKSSGKANPMLEFHTWEMMEIDPFYIPISKEDIELKGTNIDTPNIAKTYINNVRTRKGLPTDDKLVASATKQDNLGKNK